MQVASRSRHIEQIALGLARFLRIGGLARLKDGLLVTAVLRPAVTARDRVSVLLLERHRADRTQVAVHHSVSYVAHHGVPFSARINLARTVATRHPDQHPISKPLA